jgi:hypothetical protein
VVPGAEEAMRALKYEIAQHLVDPQSGMTLAEKVNQVGWEGMATQEVGRIGGAIVKFMQIKGEMEVADLFKREGHARLEGLEDVMNIINQNESNSELPRKDFPGTTNTPDQRRANQTMTTEEAGGQRH